MNKIRRDYMNGYDYWVREDGNRWKYAPEGIGTALYKLGYHAARYLDAIKGPFVLIMTGWYNYRDEWAEWSPQTKDRRELKRLKRAKLYRDIERD